jgi:hypothetical protein
MAMPTGMGSGKGRGLTGLAIMVIAKVWLTCVFVAPLTPDDDDDDARGRGL